MTATRPVLVWTAGPSEGLIQAASTRVPDDMNRAHYVIEDCRFQVRGPDRNPGWNLRLSYDDSKGWAAGCIDLGYHADEAATKAAAEWYEQTGTALITKAPVVTVVGPGGWELSLPPLGDDDTVTVCINGRPVVGVDKAGAGWWPDNETWTRLTPPAGCDPRAFALGEHMSGISEEVYSAGWIQNNEWVLWRALQDWRTTGHADWSPGWDITEFMPRLDKLQRAAGGWVWWMDGPDGGRQWVPTDRWVQLVDAHEHRPHLSNGELATLVPGLSAKAEPGTNQDGDA